MAQNMDKTRSLITTDDETASLPRSVFLDPNTYTLNADNSITVTGPLAATLQSLLVQGSDGFPSREQIADLGFGAELEPGQIAFKSFVAGYTINAASFFQGFRVNTSYAIGSATNIVSGNIMARFTGGGFADDGLYVGPEVRISATENWSASAQGAGLSLWATSNGSITPTERVRVRDVVEVRAAGTGYTSVITPTQLTGNTDNWAPTDFATAYAVRMSSSININLTGIAGGAAGRQILLINVGLSNITLKNNQTSTAANQFLTPGAADIILNNQDSAVLWYDSTSSRWRVIQVTG